MTNVSLNHKSISKNNIWPMIKWRNQPVDVEVLITQWAFFVDYNINNDIKG